MREVLNNLEAENRTSGGLSVGFTHVDRHVM